MIRYLSITIFCLIIIGCNSSKKMVTGGSFKERSNEELIDALIENNTTWDWYAVKSRIDVNLSDDKFKGTAYIRMQKDSVIWSMVKKFGVEAARALVDEHQGVLLNRLQTEYTVFKTRDLARKTGLSLGLRDLQEFILGNVILSPEDHYDIHRKGNEYLLSFRDGDFTQEYYIDARSLLLTKSRSASDQYNYIEITYNDYKTTKYGTFPYERHVSVVMDGANEADINIHVKELLIDVPKKIPFSIPSHYDKNY